MSKHKVRNLKNYILRVDNHRKLSMQRNTAGRYRVGAKSEKEAIKLLQKKIQFGSIQVYYQCDDTDITIGYKEIVKEIFVNKSQTYIYEKPLAATEARK